MARREAPAYEPACGALHRLVRHGGPVAYGRKAEVRSSARNDAIDPSRHFERINCCGAQHPHLAIVGYRSEVWADL